MKKSLLALAVLGAFAGAASAQSSVTLFGIVDVNARYVDNNGVKQYQLSQDGINSSRLGFRGSEDLGGGMAASFWLEGSLNPDTGTATGQTWTRRSTVSLSGGWGEMRLGRDYTATFWNWTIFDPFGTNGVGASSNLGLGGAVQSVPTGGSYATAVRANNIIAYFLPSGIAGGLYGQVQVAAGENAFGNKYFGGRLGYAAGPFDVAGAFGRTQLTNDLDATNYNFGGSWDFKFMKLMGFYGRLEVGQTDQDNWFIGAQAPLGLWTFKATYGEVDRSGGPVNNQKASQIAVGAVYDLSKRTALYGTWSGINNKSGASFAVAPLINNPANGSAPNMNSQGLEFGVRHAF
jgi:predicted porin